MYEAIATSSFIFAVLGILVGLAFLRVSNRKPLGKALAIGCFFIALASCEYNRSVVDRRDKQEALSHGYANVNDWKVARQQLIPIEVGLGAISQRRAAQEAERLRLERNKQEEDRRLQEEERKRQEEQRCATELKCIGDKIRSYATVYCPRYVERLAKNDFQWTDGWLDEKFSHYRWANGSHRTITFIGDKIKFQNGFGAWTYHTYECDVDPAPEHVVDVRAHPGRLLP
ncbi:hypothetical protein ACFLEY_19185 [Bradyrhizobium sp. YCK136]|uniref:hypothetical protein n=1 Tax=Bradyrhizobium sp. YCK136 TaxID=3351346 RepID=UPI0037C6E596